MRAIYFWVPGAQEYSRKPGRDPSRKYAFWVLFGGCKKLRIDLQPMAELIFAIREAGYLRKDGMQIAGNGSHSPVPGKKWL